MDDGRSIPFHLSDRMRPCPVCPSTVTGDRRRFLRWLDRSLKRTPGPYGLGFWVWFHATLGQMICVPSGNPHYIGPAFGRNSLTKRRSAELDPIPRCLSNCGSVEISCFIVSLSGQLLLFLIIVVLIMIITIVSTIMVYLFSLSEQWLVTLISVYSCYSF